MELYLGLAEKDRVRAELEELRGSKPTWTSAGWQAAVRRWRKSRQPEQGFRKRGRQVEMCEEGTETEVSEADDAESQASSSSLPALDASLSSTRMQKVLAFLLQFAAAISRAGVPQWASAAIESGEQTWQLLQHAGLGGGGNAASFCRQLAVRYLQQAVQRALLDLLHHMRLLVQHHFGYSWACMPDIQSAQGLCCEARKWYSAEKENRYVKSGAPYLPLAAAWIRRMGLPWPPAPEPSSPDAAVLTDCQGQLLNLYEAQLSRWASAMGRSIAVARKGASEILHNARFASVRLLHWLPALDRHSLHLWHSVLQPAYDGRQYSWPPYVRQGQPQEQLQEEQPAPLMPEIAADLLLSITASTLIVAQEPLRLRVSDPRGIVAAVRLAESTVRWPYGRAVDQAVRRRQQSWARLSKRVAVEHS
ncbi:unnamed protein product, partial [Effrenium voratum]